MPKGYGRPYTKSQRTAISKAKRTGDTGVPYYIRGTSEGREEGRKAGLRSPQPQVESLPRRDYPATGRQPEISSFDKRIIEGQYPQAMGRKRKI